ncbi:hypothetical protein QTP86_006632 [Hemibagrus guttatus]|nr:hypothetical protein QTP86_006632 [Hemibagrus guttatus]
MLERRGMKVSRSKTEYMCVNEREGSGTVRLQGEEVKKVQEFKYLGSTVQSNGECGKERLRTENRLLKQRIDTLEKGQVTRAQEAEENYLVKRELATVKQQSEEVSAQLKQAQSTIRQLQQQQQPVKGNARYSEESILQLERELVQARLKEAESQCALKEMQDKILEIEKRNTSLPDESNVVRLQEELIAVKIREAEALTGLKELRQQVRDLEEHWQNQIHSNQLRRAEQETRSLHERLQILSTQNKLLHSELQETKRKQAEIECKNKEEVMAVRLREADNMAAMAELQQQISDLEIQKEEGRVQGQLNNTDSNQYIRDLKDQIAELREEICCLKGQRGLPSRTNFDRIHIVNHYGGDDESNQSSDDDCVKLPLSVNPCRDGGRITLHPQLEDTDSEADEDGESLRLKVPSNSSHKSTTV